MGSSTFRQRTLDVLSRGRYFSRAAKILEQRLGIKLNRCREMVTSLSKLVDMIQSGSVPEWFRDEVVNNREQIVRDLIDHGEYSFKSPGGEQITIYSEKEAAA
jgi:hypothetical protein